MSFLKPFMTEATNSFGSRPALKLPLFALPSGFNSVSTAGGTTSKTLIPVFKSWCLSAMENACNPALVAL